MGSEALNHYGEWLRTMGGPMLPNTGALWISRLVLLVAVIFHIHSAYALTMMNRKARPVGYADRDYVKGTYAARTMRWGGVIILLFVIYHLLHLTTGDAHHDFIPGDVFHNVVTGFQVWWVAAVYIIANLALGLHLYHGVWAMFSSVGMTNPRFEHWRRTFATVFAIVITAANIAFPMSVLMGFVHL
jgi:succinate dehydrogenase / fumarate reductase cytochrome b subunit